MKNLDIERAKVALLLEKAAGSAKGNLMSGLPDKIVKNGLIGTLAFLTEKKGDHAKVGDAISTHLANMGLVSEKVCTLDALMAELVKGNGGQLKNATNEVLAFLVIAKRLVRKE